MVIEDDGCGFDVETTLRTSTASGHLGLYGMRECTMLLGGSVTIESKRGKGTAISVHIPFEPWGPLHMDEDGQQPCGYQSR